MARIIKKSGAGNEEVELNDEALENEEVENEGNETVENGESSEEGVDSDEEIEEEIKEEEAEPNKAPVTQEKVRLAKNLSCHIGGKFYNFKAGHEYFVDANVKSILKKADYLEAI